MTGRDELPHGRVTNEGSIRVVTKNVWTEQDSDWLGALLPLLRVCILVIRTDYIIQAEHVAFAFCSWATGAGDLPCYHLHVELAQGYLCSRGCCARCLSPAAHQQARDLRCPWSRGMNETGGRVGWDGG